MMAFGGHTVGEQQDTQRFLRALESIAQSLEKLANPVVNNGSTQKLEAVAQAANELWRFCASDWTDKPVDPEIMREVNAQARILGEALNEAGIG